MKKQVITEDQGIQKQWYEDAKKQTPETLPSFIAHLLNDYQHDYGTCVHATAAISLAAAWAANSAVGLSGFQAGGVMWQFIKEWQYSSNKTGLKILDYDNVLYPQYADKFEGQNISPQVWNLVQKEARKQLQDNAQKEAVHLPNMAAWQKEMEEFKKEHPDYDERPAHYQHISFGTMAEHDAYQQKRATGFKFAPSEPYAGTAHPDTILHWERIAQGELPFGMILGKD